MQRVQPNFPPRHCRGVPAAVCSGSRRNPSVSRCAVAARAPKRVRGLSDRYFYSRGFSPWPAYRRCAASRPSLTDPCFSAGSQHCVGAARAWGRACRRAGDLCWREPRRGLSCLSCPLVFMACGCDETCGVAALCRCAASENVRVCWLFIAREQ
jgi:hypothetical protein